MSEIAILNKESYKKAEMIGAYRYLDTASLTENFIAKYIDLNGKENNIPSRARRKVEPNDILVSTVRPTQKHFGIIEQPVQNLVASTGFVTITPYSQLVNPYYLYILLTQEKVTNYLQVIAENSTSAYPSIKPSVIADLEFKFPERDIQDKIANLYKAIEGKIKVNQQINDNLVQQAKALYDSMFVRNADGLWPVGILADIANITMGQSPSGTSYNEDGNGEVFFQGRGEFGDRFPTRRLYTTEPTRMAERGDVLMSVRAPVGDLNVAYERCCIGRGLGAIHSKDGAQSFLLYTMFSLHNQLNVYNGEGTVFGSINRDALNSMSITIPHKESIQQFEKVVKPMDAVIESNYSENIRLQSIRDALMSKLISGEIDVSDVNLLRS